MTIGRLRHNSSLIKYYLGSKEGLLMAILERDAERSMADFENLVRLPVSAEQKMQIHINGIINVTEMTVRDFVKSLSATY